MSTRTKDLEHRIEIAEQQLHLYQRISRYMTKDMPLSESLQGIVSLVVEFMKSDSCLIYLLDGDRLVLCASNDPAPGAIGNVSLKLDEGLTGWVARERRLLAISREAYSDPRFKFFSSLPEDTFEAFLSAPVISRNRVVGVINVQHRNAHSHSGSELEMITTVGEQVGCLLMMARLAASPQANATNHAELIFAAAAQR